ncbi:hypothetical protein DVH24_010092 [Malus domestica]|uniref:PdxS/SNZ N-terminal domain-containing protein n=1 Tax=Malus domestica TaxID=3750 RepID=A0A498JS62_MALDO|nr:hypothetical protein DVH24_010092 [Malus domestica]
MHYRDSDVLAEVSCGLGEAMVGLNLKDEKVERRGDGGREGGGGVVKEDSGSRLKPRQYLMEELTDKLTEDVG